MPEANTVKVTEDLAALKAVFNPLEQYQTFRDVTRHLERAASLLASSTDRDICADNRVRSLLEINPDFSSFWDIVGVWYQELIQSLTAMFPDQARQIQTSADHIRFSALLAVKW